MDPMLFLYFGLAALGFGLVIVVHELGHYTFARLAGVRVEVFSLGFGPVLLRRKVGETEWCFSAVPFGGYVKMSGQEDLPSGTPQDAADPRSYLAKSVGWKSLILLGGVLYNLLSAWLILAVLCFTGLPTMPPIVGDVHPLVMDHAGDWATSPAKALGLRPFDRIVAVNGEHVRSFDDVATVTMFAKHDPLTVTVLRDGREMTFPAPGAAPVSAIYDRRLGRPSLGVVPPFSTRAVAVGGEDRGLRLGDRFVEIAGEDVSGLTGQQIEQRLLATFGEEVAVVVLRRGERVALRIRYADAGGSWQSGLGLPVRVVTVAPGSPGAAAGLRTGDVIMACDGKPIAGDTGFLAAVRRAIATGRAIELQVWRDGATLTLSATPQDDGVAKRLGVGFTSDRPGILPWLPGGALARAGVSGGEAILASTAGERDVTLTILPAGTRVVIPLALDAPTLASALKPRTAGTLERIFGDRGDPALLERLTGGKVVALLGGDGLATGSPAPGLITLKRHDGATSVVDCRLLGTAALRTLFAALQEGDWIVAVTSSGDGGHALEIARGVRSSPRLVTVAPEVVGTAIRFQPEELPYHPTSFGDGVGIIWSASQNMVVKTLQLIPRFFLKAEDGGIDPNRSLSGPVGIFRELKSRVELWGIASYIKMLALISLNLFLVNLLPIPITDGGQLVIVWIEAAIRRPIPDRVRMALLNAGLVLVLFMFVYVTGLDVLRWIGLM